MKSIFYQAFIGDISKFWCFHFFAFLALAAFLAGFLAAFFTFGAAFLAAFLATFGAAFLATAFFAALAI